MQDPMQDTDFVKKLSQHLTEVDRRVHRGVERETSSMWRSFWIMTAHKHGYSIKEIAEGVGLPEESIRAILRVE